MDINICVDKLGLNRNRYKLNNVLPPHSIEWWEGLDPQPTEAELQSAWNEHIAEHNATQYQRDRAAEYPSIEALVVALWEGVVEERMSAVTALEAIRQEIKSRYPKP